MFLKAAFKNASLFVQILMLLAVSAFGMFFSFFLFQILIATKAGISPEIIKNIQQNIFDYPNILRGVSFLQTLCIFLFPAIICAWLFSDNYKEYLGIEQTFTISVSIWTAISMIVAIPFINSMISLNHQIVFPEALKNIETLLKEMEESANKAYNLLLDTKSIPEIIFNFLFICVIVAICEEFMFRGLLQKLLGRMFKNPHILIWIVAILFSVLHRQFYGLLPRMLLGLWLGYLMYYTKSIWIPVLAHFVNNFIGVGWYYIFPNSPDEMEIIDTIGTGSTWWLAFASLALFFFCFSRIKKAISQ